MTDPGPGREAPRRVPILDAQRVASGLVALLQLAMWARVWGREVVPQLAILTLIPLACVWFPEGLSNHAGIGRRWRNIPFVERTPGVAFRLLGWTGLMGSTIMGAAF